LKPTVSIALTGPECSGKTTLCQLLSAHFNAPMVDEYAREYLADIGLNYSFFDLEMIAMGQVEAILSYQHLEVPLLFVDTDLVNLHVWAKDKFDTDITFIEENLYVQKADLYLLCAPDLPWQPDGLRQDEHRLQSIYDAHKRTLKTIGANFIEISGTGETRTKAAIDAVNAFFLEKNIPFGQHPTH